jgi:hypothetical protein
MIAITSFIRLPFLKKSAGLIPATAFPSKTRARAETLARPGLGARIARFCGNGAGAKRSLSPHLLHKRGLA